MQASLQGNGVQTSSPQSQDVYTDYTNDFNRDGVANVMQTDLSRQKRKKRIKVIIVALFVLCLIMLSAVIYKRLFGDLSLVKYEDIDYSISVPKGYRYVPGSDVVKFIEQGGDTTTRSFVVIQIKPYSINSGEDEKLALLNKYESQIPSLLGQGGVPSLHVENVSSQRIIHRDREALRITAELVKGSKRAKLDALVVAGEHAVYATGVAAHNEDAYLVRSTNKILTSLTLYE